MPEKTYTLGFKDTGGDLKKFARFRIKVVPRNSIEQIVILQYDAKELYHFTLYSPTPTKSGRFQLQIEKRVKVASEDRDKFPDVIDWNPEVFKNEFSGIYVLQTVPIWTHNPSAYPKGKCDLVVDLDETQSGSMLNSFLVSGERLKEFKKEIQGKRGRELLLWQEVTDFEPHLVLYV